MIRSLHSPDAVAAFRAALDDVPTANLRDALADLDDFRESYFETGDVGSFTRLEIECYLEDRERARGGRRWRR